MSLFSGSQSRESMVAAMRLDLAIETIIGLGKWAKGLNRGGRR
jgi:hypothetical protein